MKSCFRLNNKPELIKITISNKKIQFHIYNAPIVVYAFGVHAIWLMMKGKVAAFAQLALAHCLGFTNYR